MDNMTSLLVTTILLTLQLYCTAGQSQCKTPDHKIGKCISIFNCSSLLKMATDTTPAGKKFLRNSFCKFDGNTPWVCCPPDACITPDGLEGTCIGINSCAPIAEMLHSRPLEEVKQYAQKSRCGDPEEKKVCCSTQTTPVPTALSRAGEIEECKLTAFPPKPSDGCCGVDAGGGGNRIVGGNATTIDEYPWLAIIEYVKEWKTKLLCGGVLISGQYVLSAAHCVVGPVLDIGTPTKVRLGEYDTSNEGEDCVEVEGGGIDCTEGPLSVPIEKIIAHPGYKPDSPRRRHDIALIRLDRIVEYTDFIRPICLPTADFTKAPPDNLTLYAAGWGAVSDDQSFSYIKLKVGLPYVSFQDCQPSYNVPARQIPLWGGQLCAGGVDGQDSCKGDSGGPLMRENGRLFELVGIVSFGPTPCGMEAVAGVYSKVYHYLPWIRRHISA